MKRRTLWLSGLIWAEGIVEQYGLDEGELIIDQRFDEAYCFGEVNDFDRGAQDYLRYVRGK